MEVLGGGEGGGKQKSSSGCVNWKSSLSLHLAGTGSGAQPGHARDEQSALRGPTRDARGLTHVHQAPCTRTLAARLAITAQLRGNQARSDPWRETDELGYSHTGAPPLNRDPFHKLNGQSAVAARVDGKQSTMASFVYGHGETQGSHENMDEHGTHRREGGGTWRGRGTPLQSP